MSAARFLFFFFQEKSLSTPALYQPSLKRGRTKHKQALREAFGNASPPKFQTASAGKTTTLSQTDGAFKSFKTLLDCAGWRLVRNNKLERRKAAAPTERASSDDAVSTSLKGLPFLLRRRVRPVSTCESSSDNEARISFTRKERGDGHITLEHCL